MGGRKIGGYLGVETKFNAQITIAMEKTKTNPGQVIDLQQEAQLVLEAVAELEGKYGIGYLMQVLQGETKWFRNPSHVTLSTLGTLADSSRDRLRNLIHFLTNEDYLKVKDQRFGTLGLTEKGEEFLAMPREITARKQDLTSSRHDKLLAVALRKLRMSLAESEGKPPFRIFTDLTLQHLIQEKPTDLFGLKLIPGIGDYKANRYGPPILNTIEEVKEQMAQAAQLDLLKRIRRPSYQFVKGRFEAGQTVDQIAEERDVKLITVQRMLLDLYKAGELDLREWIEAQVAESDLEKGTEYFRQDANARLRHAYETLGLDYETLRMCKLYVARVDSYQAELQVAS